MIPDAATGKLLNFNCPTTKFILLVAIKLNFIFFQFNLSSWTNTWKFSVPNCGLGIFWIVKFMKALKSYYMLFNPSINLAVPIRTDGVALDRESFKVNKYVKAVLCFLRSLLIWASIEPIVIKLKIPTTVSCGKYWMGQSHIQQAISNEARKILIKNIGVVA